MTNGFDDFGGPLANLHGPWDPLVVAPGIPSGFRSAWTSLDRAPRHHLGRWNCQCEHTWRGAAGWTIFFWFQKWGNLLSPNDACKPNTSELYTGFDPPTRTWDVCSQRSGFIPNIWPLHKKEKMRCSGDSIFWSFWSFPLSSNKSGRALTGGYL